MSRGLGVLQRWIVVYLRDRGVVPVRALARAWSGAAEPPRSVLVSMRRAVAGLEARGWIQRVEGELGPAVRYVRPVPRSPRGLGR